MQPVEQKAMLPEIIERIDKSGVLAVLVIDEVKHAVPLAQALLAGGVDAIELTLRTDAAMDAARAIRQEVPEILLGFGTVLTVDQIKAIAEIKADFAVAPGCNPKIISAAIDYGISFAPGICTPSDIEIALEHGCRVCKYFPAETAGGLKHLSNIAGPYQYLGMKFIPLGGLFLSNAESYLDSPIITAIGGSWIAKRSMIIAGDWEGITQNAREIRALIDNKRKK
jgi:2-dehydro-3-deoxyphosphogluconate aldolase/(4S)-4-hydroxy-2-oxoglutarate aldolase